MKLGADAWLPITIAVLRVNGDCSSIAPYSSKLQIISEGSCRHINSITLAANEPALTIAMVPADTGPPHAKQMAVDIDLVVPRNRSDNPSARVVDIGEAFPGSGLRVGTRGAAFLEQSRELPLSRRILPL